MAKKKPANISRLEATYSERLRIVERNLAMVAKSVSSLSQIISELIKNDANTSQQSVGRTAIQHHEAGHDENCGIGGQQGLFLDPSTGADPGSEDGKGHSETPESSTAACSGNGV